MQRVVASKERNRAEGSAQERGGMEPFLVYPLHLLKCILCSV